MRMLIRFSTALALLPHFARAQEMPAVSADGKPLEEIVVRSSSAVPLELFQDVAGIESISAEEIEVIPATDTSQVIEHLAGIRTQQRIQGEEAAVSIEGMPPEYSLLLVDGQRWSGEIGGVGDASDIPLQNVDQIDILRGSQGARYGADAGGGVIDLVTHGAPDEGYLVQAGGAGGYYGKGLGGGTGAMRLGPVGVSLSGEYDQIGGYDIPSDPDIVNAQIGGEDSLHRQYFTYGKWDAPVGDAITLRGNGLWRVEDDDLVPEDSNEHLRRTDTNWRANVGGDWDAFTSTDLSGDATYYAIETDSHVGRDFVLDEDETSAVIGGEQWFETGPVSHTLFGGIEGRYQRLHLDEGPLPPNIESPELAANRKQNDQFFIQSLYLRNESDLTSWLTLELGARARFHSEFDTKVLPNAGVLIQPFDSLRLRASWGLSYRTPSLRDLHQPPTPQLGGAYFLSGNPNLEPEESISVRGGIEWTPARWLNFASTGFYNDIDDHIRSRPAGQIQVGTRTRTVEPDPALEAICEAQAMFFPPEDWTPECVAFFAGVPITVEEPILSNVFEKANLDSVRTWGVEVQLRLRPWSYAELAVDYTWLRTHVEDPDIDIDELPNEAEHAASVRAVLTSPWYDTSLTTALRYRSGVIPERSGTGLLTFVDSSDRTDPSYQLDFRLTQPIAQPWFAGLRVYVDALNVTDERREDSYAIRGRSFVAGISGTFEEAL
jgi:outer membrane receptor for ferrienterochelin and colicins